MARSPDLTVICTLRDEAATVDVLMSSLLNQSLRPREIVVVDGGSTDGTWERLQDWMEIFANVGVELKAVRREGANIAEGRNAAVELANNNLVASIDGGCIARKDWLEKLAARDADVVAGNFVPLADGFWQAVQAVFARRSAPRNPSSRSVMFKKTCWEKVGGYPTHLYTGEDTLFNAKLEEAGCRFRTADDAVVLWRMRPSLAGWLRQFYLYGKGDGQAGLRLGTHYGRKALATVLATYAVAAAAVWNPTTLLAPLAASLFYGLYRSLSVFGLAGGLLLPLRVLAYVLGFHAGLLKPL
jgi:glycosyltransferase involved in cell wall biosynthesis